MVDVRDHEPLVLEAFNGLWDRGDDESAPSDHFTKADNIQYFSSGFETRVGIGTHQDFSSSIKKIKRVYNYVMQTGQTLLVLTDGGKIYHIVSPTVTHGPILTIAAMDDFGFVGINGRAYITPFKFYTNAQGIPYELGIQNEFLYVYLGDGTAARKAAGVPPTGSAMTASMGATGLTDAGFHLLAVVYETDSGYLTALGPTLFTEVEFSGTNKINVANIPVSGSAAVKKRHLVSTKFIPEYNGDQKGYQFFFIPGGNIEDNTTTTKTVEFFDGDLLSDASHLIDNFSEIPSSVSLNTYHSRLVMVGEYGTTETLTGLPAGITDNRSIARLSAPGEPEAISKVDGILIAPLDGNPLTNCQEFRDVLYLFKKSRTFAYSDNNDEPSTWIEETLDQGVGAPVHGIATVLDSGGVNIDFLLVADWSGLMLFNGTYARPELSWKIEDLWMGMDRNYFRNIQMINDSLGKTILLTLPPPNEHIMLHANYGEGLNAKDIKWARWVFNVKMRGVTLIETNKIIFGAYEIATP